MRAVMPEARGQAKRIAMSNNDNYVFGVLSGHGTMGRSGLSSQTVVSREGKVSLPAAQRRAAGIEPGMSVTVRTEGSRIVIQSVDQQIADFRAAARRLLAGKCDSVDQFIADRHAEARRDEYDF